MQEISRTDWFFERVQAMEPLFFGRPMPFCRTPPTARMPYRAL